MEEHQKLEEKRLAWIIAEAFESDILAFQEHSQYFVCKGPEFLQIILLRNILQGFDLT